MEEKLIWVNLHDTSNRLCVQFRNEIESPFSNMRFVIELNSEIQYIMNSIVIYNENCNLITSQTQYE